MNQNILMSIRYTPRDSILDQNYFENLGFPILSESDIADKKVQNKLSDEYSRVYVNYAEHSAVSLSVNFNPSKPDWDSSDWIVFYIKTKDKQLIDQFVGELKSYFDELEHCINGFGFKCDKDDFFDALESEGYFFDVVLKDRVSKAINNEVKNKSSKQINQVIEDVEKQLVDEINNRSEELIEKYWIRFDDYYQDISCDMYQDDEGREFKYAFGEIENQIIESNNKKLNSNQKH